MYFDERIANTIGKREIYNSMFCGVLWTYNTRAEDSQQTNLVLYHSTSAKKVQSTPISDNTGKRNLG